MQWKVGLLSEADGRDRAEWTGQQSGTSARQEISIIERQ